MKRWDNDAQESKRGKGKKTMKDRGRHKERKNGSNTKFNTCFLLKREKKRETNDKTKNCRSNWCAHINLLEENFHFWNRFFFLNFPLVCHQDWTKWNTLAMIPARFSDKIFACCLQKVQLCCKMKKPCRWKDVNNQMKSWIGKGFSDSVFKCMMNGFEYL